MVPRLVKAVDDGKGWVPCRAPAVAVRAIPAEAGDDFGGPRWTVAGGQRPAPRRAGGSPGRDVAGKTGTAQVISNQGKERARGSKLDLRDHGWFVFMTPKDNPELAGVIFTEHGEHG